MKKVIACILAISVLLLVSCAEPSENGSSAPQASRTSSDTFATSFQVMSDSPLKSPAPLSKDVDWEALFAENYGFYPDFYQALHQESIRELAEVWLTNPIDAWGYAYGQVAMTTQDMVEVTETMAENWLREADESIAYIKTCFPEIGVSLEQEQTHYKDAAELRSRLTMHLILLANSYGTICRVDSSMGVCDLYRERAFRLLYMEAICKEWLGDAAHGLTIEMAVPEGMEADVTLEAPLYGFDDYYWAIGDFNAFDAMLADNPIDKWASEYTAEYDDYDYMHDVQIANWKREIEESTQVILTCFPELEELLTQEAEAWEAGILRQDFLSLIWNTDRYGTIHLLLARSEAVSQYRRRAFWMLSLEMACVELQDLSERPIDHAPNIAFILPED